MKQSHFFSFFSFSSFFSFFLLFLFFKKRILLLFSVHFLKLFILWSEKICCFFCFFLFCFSCFSYFFDCIICDGIEQRSQNNPNPDPFFELRYFQQRKKEEKPFERVSHLFGGGEEEEGEEEEEEERKVKEIEEETGIVLNRGNGVWEPKSREKTIHPFFEKKKKEKKQKKTKKKRKKRKKTKKKKNYLFLAKNGLTIFNIRIHRSRTFPPDGRCPFVPDDVTEETSPRSFCSFQYFFF